MSCGEACHLSCVKELESVTLLAVGVLQSVGVLQLVVLMKEENK